MKRQRSKSLCVATVKERDRERKGFRKGCAFEQVFREEEVISR